MEIEGGPGHGHQEVKGTVEGKEPAKKTEGEVRETEEKPENRGVLGGRDKTRGGRSKQYQMLQIMK